MANGQDDFPASNNEDSRVSATEPAMESATGSATESASDPVASQAGPNDAPDAPPHDVPTGDNLTPPLSTEPYATEPYATEPEARDFSPAGFAEHDTLDLPPEAFAQAPQGQFDSLSPAGLAGGVYATSEALKHAASRLPPHSIESEQALLGGLLLSPDSFENSADIVVESDFCQYDHRLIYRAIVALASDNSPTDVVTITVWLEQNALLADAGGLQYLQALAEESPGAANITAYANIVRERSVLRQLIAASNEITDAAYTPEGRSSKDLLDFAESKVFSIADQTVRSTQGFSNIKSVLASTLDRISYLFETQEAITGLGTGFTELDEKTSGLQSSDLIIVAGRPSMGKTTFAMNIAENAAISGDYPVAVFSMEMPADQLAMRMIASLGRIELQKLRTGKLSEQDWPRITSAISLLNAKRNLFIDDTPALTPTDVRARARRLKREHGGIGLIVIDYLQLMRLASTTENKATEIAEISRSLKALAKELDVPIIALSQLNRSLEQRPDKRPIMSDLRESGAIEQDADVIMFIYREEVYEPDKEEVKGLAEVLIRKQRNGPIGACKLSFIGSFTRFENFSPEMAARQFGQIGNQPQAGEVAKVVPASAAPASEQGSAGSNQPVSMDDF